MSANDAVAPSAPPGNPRALALEVESLSEVIQRSLVEVGPMVRLAKGLTNGISPDALVRAAGVLTEAANFYEDMMAAVGELHTSSSRLARAVATGADNPAS